jgi:hypothetical protein
MPIKKLIFVKSASLVGLERSGSRQAGASLSAAASL